jgi:hypothetical protein
LDPAAIDGEASGAFDQRGGAGSMVARAFYAHRFRRNDTFQIGRFFRRGNFRFPADRLQAFHRVDELVFEWFVLGVKSQCAFVKGLGCRK